MFNPVLLYYTAWSGSHWDYGPRCLGSCGIGHFCLGPAPQQVRRNPKSEKSTESEAPSQSIFDQYFDISGTICSGGSGCLRIPGMQWMRLPSGLRLSLPTSLSLSTKSETFTFPFYSKWNFHFPFLLKVKDWACRPNFSFYSKWNWACQLHFPFLFKVRVSEPANLTFPFYSKWKTQPLAASLSLSTPKWKTEPANLTFPFYSKVKDWDWQLHFAFLLKSERA